MRINFDFTDLEAFLAVLETGSFHLASAHLGLSQSSVTRRIRKLEVALDTPLFNRTTRDVRPTLAAKRLKVRAEHILGETRETARALRDESSAYAHQLSQSLTIATVPTVIAGLLAPALKCLQQEFPSARYRVLDIGANEVAEAVAEGEADIGICPVPAFEPTTTFEFIFDDPLVIALLPEHRLASRPNVSWADVSEENLILPRRGTGNRMLIDDALARTGVPLVWTIEVGRTTTALDCVCAGLGIAPLPKSAIIAQERAPFLVKPVAAPAIARPIGLLKRKGYRDGVLSRRFSEAIRASAAPDFALDADA
ncbi:LysR family transcriptional regulator [Primorskyibacter sp. S187A]|uniref:LysR family transcriptional regulator n=1 Tax=Primorskyibacter sp. S187A TaxID=3415130 RepID=UPI003C7A2CDB